MGFVQRDPDAFDCARAVAEVAVSDGGRQAIEDDSREELGRRVAPGERRLFVQVLVGQRAKDRVHAVRRAADVDDDAVGIQVGSAKLDIHDVGRTVQLARGAEHLAAKAVGNHHVTADGDAIHR